MMTIPTLKHTPMTEPTKCLPPFDPDGVNLDAMSQSDLLAFTEQIGHGVRPVTAALALFPGRSRGTVKATVKLHGYAWNKIAAMQCRGRGDIDTALMYEGICDRIYQALPDWARFW